MIWSDFVNLVLINICGSLRHSATLNSSTRSLFIIVDVKIRSSLEKHISYFQDIELRRRFTLKNDFFMIYYTLLNRFPTHFYLNF